MKRKEARKNWNIKGRLKAVPGTVKTAAGRKTFRLGTYTTATTAIVIAVLVILNLCVDALPEKYTAIDTTKNGLYSISEQTEDLVSALKEDVNIYYIVQDGSEDETLLQMLEHYKDLSSHIKLEYVDPVKQPTFASSYTSAEVYTGSLIVECGEKSRYVDYYDIFETSYGYDEEGNYTVSSAFNGEGALTSAIDYVTSETVTTIYVLAGHGEASLSDGFSESLEYENISVETLNLLTEGDIPADCDCLLINAPTADLSKSEAALLSDWLASGGRMLLMTDCITESQTNLSALMAEFGVEHLDGMVVEGNQNYYVQSYANYLLPEIVSHEITDPLLSGGYYILMPFAHGMEIDDEAAEDAGVEISVLLRSSTSSYVKRTWQASDSADMESGDITTDSGFPLGVAITAEMGEDGETAEAKETRIVWFASSYLGYDAMNESVYGANFDLLMNSISWICEKEDSITIHAKSFDESYLTLTAAQTTRWSVILVAVIPLTAIVAGIVMWRKRKKK